MASASPRNARPPCAVGPHHRIRGAALRQDRRARRRARRAAARARAAGMAGLGGAAPVSRCDRRCRWSSDSPFSVGGRADAEVAVFERPSGMARARCSSMFPSSTIATACTAQARADYPDNALRFGVLVRAALEFAARTGVRPSLVHAHDWQAGLAPVYLRTLYEGHPVLGGAPSVFTIHNLAYQGVFAPDWLPRLDLPGRLLSIDRLEYLGTHQLPERRHQRCGPDHDGQPEVRGGNPDARVGIRVRRHPAPPGGRSRRHPERHRHRQVGSGNAIRFCRRRSVPAICRTSGRRRRRCWSGTGCPSTSAR